VDYYSIADVIKPHVGEAHIGQRIAQDGRFQQKRQCSIRLWTTRSWAHPYSQIAPGGYTGQRMIERLDMQLRLPNSSRRNGIIIVLRRESGYLRGPVNPFLLGY
jgi:hypothetical protein